MLSDQERADKWIVQWCGMGTIKYLDKEMIEDLTEQFRRHREEERAQCVDLINCRY